MTDAMRLEQAGETAPPSKSLLGRFASQYANGNVPFDVAMPDGTVQRFGKGAPTFRLTITNKNGIRAVTSLDDSALIHISH